MIENRPTKPLGIKAYGHIAHLPGSRLGPGDHRVPDGQGSICTSKTRDKHDTIIVQEKLDGTCVSVARIEGTLVPLIRAGYPAINGRYEQHHLFADWVYRHLGLFEWLTEGERVVGEWLAQAHGTRYALKHEPFVAFDIMRGTTREVFEVVREKTAAAGLVMPALLHLGSGVACSIEEALSRLDPTHHGAIDAIEGCVWRCQRKGRVEFLAKYVRPDKIDGCHLPEISGEPPIWNWHPSKTKLNPKES